MSIYVRILKFMWYLKENIELIGFENENDRIIIILVMILKSMRYSEENTKLIGF
jgi:hypothetical protein